MIRARIQIGTGLVFDTYDKWGFIYKIGDRRFSPPEKKRDSTSYAEEAGKHEDARTVEDAFEYKVNFLIQTPNTNLASANAKIHAFNEAIRTRTAGSDIKTCKTVTFYDDYKRCKIVGIPELIETVNEKDYHRIKGDKDCVVVELKISVSNPKLCDFNMQVTANS